MSSLIAREYSAFPLTEVSASEVPAILKKVVSKEATSEATILQLSWQPDCVYIVCDVIQSDLKLAGMREPATDLHLSQGQQNLFFPCNYPLSLSSMLSFRSLEHVWLKIIWLKSSHNPEWSSKDLLEAIRAKSLRRNDITKTQPGC